MSPYLICTRHINNTQRSYGSSLGYGQWSPIPSFGLRLNQTCITSTCEFWWRPGVSRPYSQQSCKDCPLSSAAPIFYGWCECRHFGSICLVWYHSHNFGGQGGSRTLNPFGAGFCRRLSLENLLNKTRVYPSSTTCPKFYLVEYSL